MVTDSDAIDLTDEDEPIVFSSHPPSASSAVPSSSTAPSSFLSSVPFYTPHSHKPTASERLHPLFHPPASSQPSQSSQSSQWTLPPTQLSHRPIPPPRTSHLPLPPSASPAPRPPSTSVVDLTDEEEDKQPYYPPSSSSSSFPHSLSSSSSPSPSPASSRPLTLPSSVKTEIDMTEDDPAPYEVKFGTLLGFVRTPNPLLHLHPGQVLTLYHAPTSDDPHRLRVSTDDEDEVGTLNREASVALVPLLLAQRVSCEARVASHSASQVVVRVALYGLEGNKREVEFKVRHHNSIHYFDVTIPDKYLQHSAVPAGSAAAGTGVGPSALTPYPGSYPGSSGYTPVQPYLPAAMGPSIGDVESHLDRLFDTEDRSAGYDIDISGLVVPEVITTPMHDYQRQGLVWMVQRELQVVDWKVAKRPAAERKLDPFTGNEMPEEDTVETFLSWERRTDKRGNVLYFNKAKNTRPQVKEPEFIRGGILADDMGLGKTLQLIALIAAGKERGEEGPTLVVCPLSVITNWQQQLESHLKETHRWRVYTYHGNARVKEADVLMQNDVVITTYNIVSSEWIEDEKESKEEKEQRKREAKERGAAVSRRRKDDDDANEDEFPGEDARSAAALNSPLFSIRWVRCILDEAHNIRERRTRQSRACRALAAQSRWAVTGTPFQNRIDDGFALMHFLRIEPFTSHYWWTKLILQPIKERRPAGVERLQRIMSSICLRRQKGDKLNGRKILELPEKRSRYIQVPLNAEEKALYSFLEQSAKKEFASLMQQGAALSQFARLLEMLLRLRQCFAEDTEVLTDRGFMSRTEVFAACPELAPSSPTAALASDDDALPFGGAVHAYTTSPMYWTPSAEEEKADAAVGIRHERLTGPMPTSAVQLRDPAGRYGRQCGLCGERMWCGTGRKAGTKLGKHFRSAHPAHVAAAAASRTAGVVSAVSTVSAAPPLTTPFALSTLSAASTRRPSATASSLVSVTSEEDMNDDSFSSSSPSSSSASPLLFASLDPSTGHLVYLPATSLVWKHVTSLVEFTHAAEAPNWAEDADEYGLTPDQVERMAARSARHASGERLKEEDKFRAERCSNGVSLLVSRQHDMYAQVGMAVSVNSYNTDWTGDYVKVKAGSLLTHDVRRRVRMTGRATAGVDASADSDDQLLFVAALGLSTTAQIDDFLWLYGYWLGDGCLDVAHRAVDFSPKKKHDQEEVQKRLEALGFTVPSASVKVYNKVDGRREFLVKDERWVGYFFAEYGPKYGVAAASSSRPHTHTGLTTPLPKSVKWLVAQTPSCSSTLDIVPHSHFLNIALSHYHLHSL